MKYLVHSLAAAVLGSCLVAATEAEAGRSLDSALRASCAKTTCTIRNNPGGDVAVFQRAAREVLAERKKLVIDGLCASACVILADLARANTCITPRAQMAVHKASIIKVTGRTYVGNREVAVGELVARNDPPQSPDIDRWIKSHGGYPIKGMNVIPVKDAKRFWAMC